MKKSSDSKMQSENKSPQKLVESIDYYFDNGLMVLTTHFLRKRGYCCGNNCRHCPYEKNINESQKKNC